MAFRYTLRQPNGSDAGEVELADPACAGDEIRIGGRRVRVWAVVPTERIEEFVDQPRCGFLVVEPIDD